MPLFLKPIFHEKMWGGNKLETFGYQLPNQQIGECWESQLTLMVKI